MEGSATTLAVEQKAQPKLFDSIDVGELVYLLYWIPKKAPNGQDLGSWETTDALVVSKGTKLVCVELSSNIPIDWLGEWNHPPASTLRFVKPTIIFDDPKEAIRYATETPDLKKTLYPRL